MEEYKDIDKTLIRSKEMITYLDGQINKLLDKDPMDVTVSDKKRNLSVFKDLITASDQLNSNQAKRNNVIVNFVEGMRHKVLDDNQLPDEPFEIQKEEFQKLWGVLVKDYDKITEDYYS